MICLAVLAQYWSVTDRHASYNNINVTNHYVQLYRITHQHTTRPRHCQSSVTYLRQQTWTTVNWEPAYCCNCNALEINLFVLVNYSYYWPTFITSLASIGLFSVSQLHSVSTTIHIWSFIFRLPFKSVNARQLANFIYVFPQRQSWRHRTNCMQYVAMTTQLSWYLVHVWLNDTRAEQSLGITCLVDGCVCSEALAEDTRVAWRQTFTERRFQSILQRHRYSSDSLQSTNHERNHTIDPSSQSHLRTLPITVWSAYQGATVRTICTLLFPDNIHKLTVHIHLGTQLKFYVFNPLMPTVAIWV